MEENVTLENFCLQLSTSDKRVELIGAFYHTEKVAGLNFSTPDDYAVRYEDFANAPA